MRLINQLAILVIDDEPRTLQTFAAQFKDDFTVLTAPSGKEALNLLRSSENEIAAVIVDQRMPEMTGLELMLQIKKEFPQIVRVLFTGFSDTKVVESIVNQAGIFKYIHKPYERVKVSEVLEESVQKYADDKEKRKHLDATLRIIQEKTARAMEEYTGWIAHHVNNALQSVQTFMEMVLPRVQGDEAEKEFAKTAAGYVRRIGEIVKTLMRIYTSGLEQFVRTPISVLAEFENEETVHALQEKKITVKKEVRDRDFEIMADPMGIQESLRKLVLNAAEASPEGSSIEVSAAHFDDDGKDAVLFQVKDRGKGIPPEIKDKIFFPFLKIAGGENIRGLGLPYVHAMVARHGGDILIDSLPGKGTTVTFTLPVLQQQSENSLMDQKAIATFRRNQRAKSL